MKLISKKRDVIELTTKALANGKNYIYIANELTKMGFLNRRGKPVTNADLSNFLLKHSNIRQYWRGKKRGRRASPASNDVPSGVTRPASQLSARMTDIEDVITSNITPALKVKLIRLLTSEGL